MLRLKMLRQMLRLLATALMLLVGLDKLALAQTTVMPGPGGTPIAPGSPVTGYTPGGIGPGGVGCFRAHRINHQRSVLPSRAEFSSGA